MSRFLALLLCGPLLVAQQSATPPDRAEIEARITALVEAAEAQDGEPSEEAEQERVELSVTLEALRRAETARELAAQFARDAEQEIARLDTLESELAEPARYPPLVADPELELDEIQALFDRANAELASARSLVEELTNQRKERLARSQAIINELAVVQQELDGRLEVWASPTGEMSPRQRAGLAAEIDALRAQIAVLEAEQTSTAALRDVQPLRRQKAERDVARAEQVAAFWQEQLGERRLVEAEAASREAERRRAETVERFPELESLAIQNQQLARMLADEDGFSPQIVRVEGQILETVQRQDEVERRYRSARERIALGGLTEGMGLVLRRDLAWLPTPADLRAADQESRARLAEVSLQLVTTEDEFAASGTLEQRRERFFRELGVEDPSPQVVEFASELLASQRAFQEAVQRQAELLIVELFELKEALNVLAATVESYRSYIEERILWVRNVAPNPLPSLIALPVHAIDFTLTTDWAGALFALGRATRANLGRIVPLTLSLLGLVGLSFYLRRKRVEMAELVASYRSDKFLYTLRAFLQCLLLALPLPLLVWELGWLLVQAATDLTHAAGTALREVAVVFGVLELTRQIAKDRSLGDTHFRWSTRSMRALRSELLWFEPIVIGVGVIAIFFDTLPHPVWPHSLGRTGFVVVMVALALFLHRLLRPASTILVVPAQKESTLLGRARRVWWRVAVTLAVVLVLLSLTGYSYTAFQLEERLRQTLGLAALLVLVNAFLARWLFITRRRLAVEQARQRARTKASTDPQSQPIVDGDTVDIPQVDAQTRELFRSSITIAAMVGLYLIWSSALPALRGLDRVQLLPWPALLDTSPRLVSDSVAAGAPLEKRPAASVEPASNGGAASGSLPSSLSSAPAGGSGIGGSLGLPTVLTLADVTLALIFALITLMAARNVPGLLEISLLQRLPLDAGARYAVTTIVRYLIVILGVSAATSALGLGWEKIQWLAAALTFGLAFGMQEIFANFVSGLIILLERPIRVGDYVTVAGTDGRVTRLRMRATTVQDFDRRELLIPNKEFITGNVINWTLSDPVTRLVIPVGIAYGSDTKKARSLLMKVARDNPMVLEDPGPSAIFREFGDSSLLFQLRVYFASFDQWPELIDQMHSDIDFAFREAGIEIAFPQRDLHLRSVPEEFMQRRDAPIERAEGLSEGGSAAQGEVGSDDSE